MPKHANMIEIHQFKVGLSDQEIDEGRIDSGSVSDLITLYGFRDADEARSELIAVLILNDQGRSLWSEDPFGMLEEESTAKVLGISAESFMRLCWLSLFPEEIEDGLDTELLLEVEGEDYGGELNITAIKDVVRANKQACLVCFSQFAACDIPIGESAPDPARFELDYQDDREAVRLYHGA